MEIQNPDAVAKFRTTLTLLLEKTRANAVSWRRVTGTGVDQYVAEFPAEKIAIAFVSPSADPDFYAAALKTVHNGVVLEIRGAEGGPDWDLMGKLYAEAERSATGWDKALADIEKFLHESGRLHPTSAPITGDDIPF